MAKGDCIICFQTTRNNRRHCEECLAKKREQYYIKVLKKRCHPENQCLWPEIFGNVDNNTST